MTLQESMAIMTRAYAKRRAESVENFVCVYLNAHPELSIDDIELVEKRVVDETDVVCTWFCRKKEGDR